MTLRHESPPTEAAANIANGFAALVPELETARLTLRAPRTEDFPAYAEIACATGRSAGIGGPMTRADAWWDDVQLASCWMLHGHGGWTVTRTGATRDRAAEAELDSDTFVYRHLNPEALT